MGARSINPGTLGTQPLSAYNLLALTVLSVTWHFQGYYIKSISLQTILFLVREPCNHDFFTNNLGIWLTMISSSLKT